MDQGVGQRLFGFTDFEAFHDAATDTRVLLSWRDGQLLLAFRGTASAANAVTDMKAWQTPVVPRRYHAGRLVKAHAGGRVVCCGGGRGGRPGWWWWTERQHLNPSSPSPWHPSSLSFSGALLGLRVSPVSLRSSARPPPPTCSCSHRTACLPPPSSCCPTRRLLSRLHGQRGPSQAAEPNPGDSGRVWGRRRRRRRPAPLPHRLAAACSMWGGRLGRQPRAAWASSPRPLARLCRAALRCAGAALRCTCTGAVPRCTAQCWCRAVPCCAAVTLRCPAAASCRPPPCTGHSLGGALAIPAAYDLQRLFPAAYTTVYTFGSPRVGAWGSVGDAAVGVWRWCLW